MLMNDINFIQFTEDVNGITLPPKFTFPFDYSPHPLAYAAANQLQQYLENQTDWKHDFGIDNPNNPDVMGKMFGVLVVKNEAGKLGFLQAFSGIIGKKTQLPLFVPPIFDRLQPSFSYLQKEQEIVATNQKLHSIQNDPSFKQLQSNFQSFLGIRELEVNTAKSGLKQNKKRRQKERKLAKEALNKSEYEQLHLTHQIESRKADFHFKTLKKAFIQEKENWESQLDTYLTPIENLKKLRKKQSAEAQELIFDQYQFQNAKGEITGIQTIFDHTPAKTPPSGAGDCAAPKLMQYAYLHNLTPIALAEFWWGKSPKLEVRQHKKYYPACKAKCHPILTYMLKGLTVDPNPVLNYDPNKLVIETIFEDDWIILISKPTNLLSVPGKEVKDSVQERLAKKYPKATGPMIVHRLDMGTSGIMVIAKDLKSYHHLQNQFISRTVIKQYSAILDGIPVKTNPIIKLPLRVDLNNRPHQVVCAIHGKPAETRWKLVEVRNNLAVVKFYPVTGRTHQLRVHASHPKGLNTPILGDELYGTRQNRLHLHASEIEFIHPCTNKRVKFSNSPPF